MELLETYRHSYPLSYIGREWNISDENYPDVFFYANNIENKKYIIYKAKLCFEYGTVPKTDKKLHLYICTKEENKNKIYPVSMMFYLSYFPHSKLAETLIAEGEGVLIKKENLIEVTKENFSIVMRFHMNIFKYYIVECDGDISISNYRYIISNELGEFNICTCGNKRNPIVTNRYIHKYDFLRAIFLSNWNTDIKKIEQKTNENVSCFYRKIFDLSNAPDKEIEKFLQQLKELDAGQ